MRSYCTLFDKNYLYQGVALYNSLKRVAGEFELYVLCMDRIAYNMMTQIKSDNLHVISVDDLLTTELSVVRERTTHGQFCWVCQPIICQFVLDKFGVDMVTYLEADSMFFSDPEVLFAELGNKSVSLVPHNYSPGFDQTENAGKFCVQFNAFRNDNCARSVLSYWKDSCFLYDKIKQLAPGQTTLDNWPEKFDCVQIINNRGAGVAPWNIQHGKLNMIDSVPYVDGVPVVFYHYHEYGRYVNGSHELGHYPLTRAVVDNFYADYVSEIRGAEELVRTIDPTFLYRREYKNAVTLKDLVKSFSFVNAKKYLRVIKRKVSGKYNVIPDSYFSHGSKKVN